MLNMQNVPEAVNGVHQAVANLIAYGLPALFAILTGVALWREYEKYMTK